MRTAAAPLRLWRSAAVTTTVLCLAAASHLLGGGRLPTLPVLVLLGALVNVPVMLLAGRRLGMRSLLALLGTGQWGLHHAFAWFATSPTCTGGSGHQGAGHLHHGPTVVASCLPGDATLAHVHSGGWELPMLAAHALAIALTAFALSRGEDALWLLVAWLRPLVGVPGVPVPAASAPRLQAIRALPVLRTRCPARANRLRGPPPSSFPAPAVS
ncbi:hypothetical protein [Arthrobacter sp. JSM 101049]|uniref:hypothetical protein n=1 Tax=Arthrobacter sp. JSM 101049 TaxID=929097 RepID=UPI003566A5FF